MQCRGHRMRRSNQSQQRTCNWSDVCHRCRHSKDRVPGKTSQITVNETVNFYSITSGETNHGWSGSNGTDPRLNSINVGSRHAAGSGGIQFNISQYLTFISFKVYSQTGCSFIQTISIASLQVHYYSEALPTQHGYCAGVSR